MRLAVISDIHGNLPALEAVLEDISRLGVDAVVNLGDLVGGPLDPIGTMDLLMARGDLTVRGNHDRHLFDRAPDKLADVDRHVGSLLHAEQLDFIQQLPKTAVFADTVFLCHGTATSDTEPWLDNWWDGRHTIMPDEAAVTAKAAGLDYPVLLCGHTHLARACRLADGRLIVNPGAVGLQINHGAPDARYALVERRQGLWSATLRAVPYDFAAAAAMAEKQGFPRWVPALLTGWAGPEGLF